MAMAVVGAVGRPLPRCRGDGDQALCARHSQAGGREAGGRAASKPPPQTGARALGFYEGAHPVEEAADLLYATQAKNLKDELGVTRLAVRHALLRLKQELEPAEFTQLIALIFKGAHTIADILRIQRSFPTDQDDQLQQEINAALDQLSADWDIDL